MHFRQIGITLAIASIGFTPFSARAGWAIERVSGNVSLERKGAKAAKIEGEAKMPLKSGDLVVTNADGKALLKDGESEVWLGPQTKFAMQKLVGSDESDGRLDVITGKARVKFKRPSGPQEFPYKVRARTVVAGVRGTEFFVAVDGPEEKVCTFEGLVRVTSIRAASQSWDVAEGRGLIIKPNEMPKVRETTKAQSEDWRQSTTF